MSSQPILEDFYAEHELIDQVAGAFRTYVEALLDGRTPASEARGFLRFFQVYAGEYHHGREETVLFRTLVEKAELPGHRGPVAVLTAEHRRLEGLLAELGTLLGGDLTTGETRDQLRDRAVAYTRSLWHHIDAENSVIFPEGQERLRRAHVRDLTGPPPSEAEAAARTLGQELVAAYPPLEDPGALRGDGCIACPAYGATCDGLEHEWWTELDWEDMQDRMNSD